MKRVTAAGLLASAFLVSGCMGSGGEATPSVVRPPDQREFVHNMDDQQRQQALAAFDQQMQAELQYLAAMYQRGRPVSTGGITITFNPLVGLVEVNFDHTLQDAPTVHSGKMVFAADQFGRPIGDTDKAGNTIPRALFANATAGMTGQALFMQGLMGIGRSAAQGAVASALNGGGGNGSVAIASSLAQQASRTETEVTVQSSGCPTCSMVD